MNAISPAPVTAVCNDLAFDAIVECCDLAASYARSAAEAAWRGDRWLLAGHLSQLRACVVTALDAHGRLDGPRENGARG
jgi:hypothetical protein